MTGLETMSKCSFSFHCALYYHAIVSLSPKLRWTSNCSYCILYIEWEMVSIMAQTDLMRTERAAQTFSFREGTPESGSPPRARRQKWVLWVQACPDGRTFWAICKRSSAASVGSRNWSERLKDGIGSWHGLSNSPALSPCMGKVSWLPTLIWWTWLTRQGRLNPCLCLEQKEECSPCIQKCP